MLRKWLATLLESNGWLIFLLYCLILWLLVFLNNEFVVTEQLYDHYMNAQMQEKYDDYDEISAEFEEDLEDFNDTEKINWTDALFDFVFLTLQSVFQFVIISAFIYVSLTFRRLPEEVTYNGVFKIVMLSEFVFFFPKIFKYAWFIFQPTDYTFVDVKNFNIFSLFGLFDSTEVADWLVYPLKFINVFEVAYVGLLVFGLSILVKVKSYEISAPVVISYLSLMLLWISFRIYLSTVF